VWQFDWTDVSGATRYHVEVSGPRARSAIVNVKTEDSSYQYVGKGYIAPANLTGWRWQVRAEVGAKWSQWAPEQVFHVAPRGDPAESRSASTEGPDVAAHAAGAATAALLVVVAASAILMFWLVKRFFRRALRGEPGAHSGTGPRLPTRTGPLPDDLELSLMLNLPARNFIFFLLIGGVFVVVFLTIAWVEQDWRPVLGALLGLTVASVGICRFLRIDDVLELNFEARRYARRWGWRFAPREATGSFDDFDRVELERREPLQRGVTTYAVRLMNADGGSLTVHESSFAEYDHRLSQYLSERMGLELADETAGGR